MTEFLAEWGPWGLALASFLAGSVVTAPSEAVLALLVSEGLDPVRLVTVATAANVAGTATLLGMARAGRRFVDGRVPADRLARVEGWLARYGLWLLALAWLPVIGDAFVVAAGLARVAWLPALVVAAIGKGARYAVVAWLVA